MKIFIDIDDTVCFYDKEFQGKMDYSKAKPYTSRITKINKLYNPTINKFHETNF